MLTARITNTWYFDSPAAGPIEPFPLHHSNNLQNNLINFPEFNSLSAECQGKIDIFTFLDPEKGN